MLAYKRTILPNGLPLVLVPMRNLGSVAVTVGVGAGGRDDPAGKAGLSHFLEHMASKGTKKRPTPFAVAKVIDSLGGEQNAGTSKEFTEYWVKLSSEYLEQAFEYLADNLRNSIFNLRQIERERGVIIEEINMYQDTPSQRIFDIFESLLYGKTSLGKELAGTKKTVKRIKREDFLSYLQSFYRSEDMVLVVAGSFEEKKVRQLAGRYFAGWPQSKRKPRKKLKFVQERPRVKVIYKKTDQAHFCLGVHGVSYAHPDRFVVSIMASVLGYSRTSRLYRRIREERGLAYYVQVLPEFYTDTGAVFCSSGVKLDKIEEAIGLVKKEFLELTRKQVPANELKRAKDYLKGRMILALEDSFNVASRYALQEVVEGKLRTPEEMMKLVNQVSADDIRRVAKKLFSPGKFYLAIIGPYKSKAPFRSLLY